MRSRICHSASLRCRLFGRPVSLRSAVGGNTAGLVFGHVDDPPRRASLHAFIHLPGPLLFLLGALPSLPSHLIGIPAVVAHELKTLVGNMLGDGGDEIAGGEDLKPTEGRLANAKRWQ